MLKVAAQTKPLLMLLLLALKTTTVIGIYESEWKGPKVDGKVGDGRCTGARYFYAPVAVRLVCPDKGCMRRSYIPAFSLECSRHNTHRLCMDTTSEKSFICEPAVRVKTAGEKDCLQFGEPNPFFMNSPEIRSSGPTIITNSTAFFWGARDHGHQDFWFVDDMEIGQDKCAVLYASVIDRDHGYEDNMIGEYAIRMPNNDMTDGYIRTELPVPYKCNDIKVGRPFIHSVSYPAREQCRSYVRSLDFLPMYITVDYMILYTSVIWGAGQSRAAPCSGVRIHPKSKNVHIERKLLRFYNDNVKLTSKHLERIPINIVRLGHHMPIYYRGENEDGKSYWTRRCKEFEFDYHRCNTRISFQERRECVWMGEVNKTFFQRDVCKLVGYQSGNTSSNGRSFITQGSSRLGNGQQEPTNERGTIRAVGVQCATPTTIEGYVKQAAMNHSTRPIFASTSI